MVQADTEPCTQTICLFPHSYFDYSEKVVESVHLLAEYCREGVDLTLLISLKKGGREGGGREVGQEGGRDNTHARYEVVQYNLKHVATIIFIPLIMTPEHEIVDEVPCPFTEHMHYASCITG